MNLNSLVISPQNKDSKSSSAALFGSILVQLTLKLQHFSLFNFPRQQMNPLNSYLFTVNVYKHLVFLSFFTRGAIEAAFPTVSHK